MKKLIGAVCLLFFTISIFAKEEVQYARLIFSKTLSEVVYVSSKEATTSRLIYQLQEKESKDNLTTFSNNSFDTLKTPDVSELSLRTKKIKADESHEDLGFMEAGNYYEGFDGVEMNKFVQVKLANVYRVNGQYEEAEYWYAQMIEETNNAEDFMNYALVLQSNGKCEKAIYWYGKYSENITNKEGDLITDCAQLEAVNASKNAPVKNGTEINEENNPR